MKNYVSIFGAMALLVTLTACESAPTTLPPGEYTSEQKSTNSQGTDTKQQTNTKVYYDQNGNKRAVQENTTTTDPKGLMNKSTTKSTTTY